MTTWLKTDRGWVDESDPDGPVHATLVMKDGDVTRVPIQFADSDRQSLADRAADPRLDPAASIAARDALQRQYAAQAVTPLYVHRNPCIFPDAVREALGAAGEAGRDTMEAVYAAYDAHIRDAWRNGEPPAAGNRDEAYAEYDARLRDSWQRG